MHQKYSKIQRFLCFGIYDCLSHPDSIMVLHIIENPYKHLLKDQKILLSNHFDCASYAQGKLIVEISFSKLSL